MPIGSFPPNQTAPANIADTALAPVPGCTFGTIYCPLSKSHQTSPLESKVARTLLMSISKRDEPCTQSALVLRGGDDSALMPFLKVDGIFAKAIWATFSKAKPNRYFFIICKRVIIILLKIYNLLVMFLQLKNKRCA